MLVRVIVGIAAILAIGGIAALLKFWNNIADWMIGSVLPWFQENFPKLEPVVNGAFRKIDSLLTPLVKKLRDDWATLRQWFIGQLVFFEKETANVYVQTVCTYFRKFLDSGEEKDEVIETRRKIDPINIPSEFRAEVVGYDRSKVNTTEQVEKIHEKMDEEISEEISKEMEI